MKKITYFIILMNCDKFHVIVDEKKFYIAYKNECANENCLIVHVK